MRPRLTRVLYTGLVTALPCPGLARLPEPTLQRAPCGLSLSILKLALEIDECHLHFVEVETGPRR